MAIMSTFEFESWSNGLAVCGGCHALVIDSTLEKMAHRQWHDDQMDPERLRNWIVGDMHAERF